ncbi:hypothetical protein B0H10DRAFT_1954727 [Mycena sp. CBHHK59/15]|nr:hypothetical protein B0H10DRAFT_1954727 [Mycena sp. CBHHK59/15]
MLSLRFGTEAGFRELRRKYSETKDVAENEVSYLSMLYVTCMISRERRKEGGTHPDSVCDQEKVHGGPAFGCTTERACPQLQGAQEGNVNMFLDTKHEEGISNSELMREKSYPSNKLWAQGAALSGNSTVEWEGKMTTGGSNVKQYMWQAEDGGHKRENEMESER